ncbi:hypothetical protein V1477_021137 [Vespula maculifrons]|uniref:Uncharacterized protein n=1 Tax=Vespula maculifrons TaxID=7453 RepID=A0ABD2AJY5_VESMC
MVTYFRDFLMATIVFLLVSGTLGLLTLAIMKIVYATEEADDAREFITNLPRDMKLKSVRENPNYPVTLDCENRGVVQEAVGKSNKRMNIVSDCS